MGFKASLIVLICVFDRNCLGFFSIETPTPRCQSQGYKGESIVINDNDKIQVDEPSNNQVTKVVRLVDVVDTIQENMEVDMVTSAVVDPRWSK